MSQWYYTHEGQQKGPVPVSELHRLAANGEFDPASSLVWTDGMSDWVPASTVPELSPPARTESAPTREATAGTPASDTPAAGQSSNPYAAPASDWSQDAPITTGGLEGLQEITPGSQPLDIGACISRAFELTKRHFGMMLVIGIIMIAVSVGASMVMGLIDSLLGWGQIENQAITGDPAIDEMVNGITSQGSILNQIVCQVVDVFLGLGITRVGLNIVSGQPFTIGMLFSQGSKTIRGFVAQILYGLMVAFGLLLLIVPGIYLALRFCHYENAIVDKDMGIMEAFGYSSQITMENKMPLFGLFILAFLIVIAGAIALLVGLLFAVPLATLIPIVSYRWLQYGAAGVQDR